MTILYKRKLEKLVQEFSNLWPVFNRILPQYTIAHPNICDLVRILLAVAPSTGPLERSYSKLAKICYKDRNQLLSANMEILYLLSTLKEPNIDYGEGNQNA